MAQTVYKRLEFAEYASDARRLCSVLNIRQLTKNTVPEQEVTAKTGGLERSMCMVHHCNNCVKQFAMVAVHVGMQ